MTEKQFPKNNAKDARAKAIEIARRAASKPSARPANNPALATSATRFDELPEYQKLQKIRFVADVIGISNPFFRSHDGHAKATSVIDGREVINFASYDYVGLNADPRTAEAAHKAIDKYGVSPSASRLVAGERPIHRELEAAIANHYQSEDAVVFVSGHATNVATIGEIMGEKDLILHDSLIHNSITVGAQLSGASRRSFRHNDLESLTNLLRENRKHYQNVLVVVEGLYSMDGDLPDLPKLIELRQRFGFWLMVDEAHALGCVGKNGKGVFEHFDVDPSDVDIWMGTLSKTLAATGGFIAGSSALIDILKSQASGFVYSVGLSPPLAASALKALEILEAEPVRAARLQANSELFQKLAKEHSLDTGVSEAFSVIPIQIGDSLKAGKLSERLFERGINVLPIAFPAVPMQQARLRFFVTSEHTHEQIEYVVKVTREELDRLDKEKFGHKIPAELLDT